MTGDIVVVGRIITRHRLRRDGEGRGRPEGGSLAAVEGKVGRVDGDEAQLCVEGGEGVVEFEFELVGVGRYDVESGLGVAEEVEGLLLVLGAVEGDGGMGCGIELAVVGLRLEGGRMGVELGKSWVGHGRSGGRFITAEGEYYEGGGGRRTDGEGRWW